MRKMTEAEWLAFVSEGTRTGKVAVVRPDGRPHVTPVWFVLDGTDLLFNTSAQSLKGKSLRRDPHVSISVDDQTPPYSFVKIDGTAEIIEDLAELRRWATAIGARYMGADRAEEFGERNGVPGELLVRVRAAHVVAERDLAA
jgi:PPOX class probable F420-dependent enzyme